jgi:lysophospholipase L1-like esterase
MLGKPQWAELSPRTSCSALTALAAVLFLIANLLLVPAGANGAEVGRHWVGSWSASQQLVEPDNALPPGDPCDATLRQIVHLSLGGNEFRLRLSNRFGNTPLHITAVHIAKPISPSSAEIVAGSDKAVKFSGADEVLIPPHADYLSDLVAFAADPLSDLAITLHIDTAPAEQTGHPGSRATSYVTHGDSVSALDLRGAETVDHWYFIAGIEVAADSSARSIVILGDSITDGHGATTNGNDRWTDDLARRLQAAATTRDVGVLNQGIGGNRLLTDGLGPNTLSRFDDDVIAQAGARYLIVLEGVNDIGMLGRATNVSQAAHDLLVKQMIAAYEQIIARAHTAQIRVIGATIMPFVGSEFYHPGPASEADRQAVNHWIRAPGHFDAVVDFDQITRDPDHPERLLPAYDSGDHLHPSPEGYAAVADAVPLSLFAGDPPLVNSARKIAFTFDDLPVHGPLPPGESRMEVIEKIISALREGHLPPTYGFINAVHLEREPEHAGVLDAWRAAGNPLGNHTWSHINLDERPLEEVEQEVLRDEPTLEKLMDAQDWHWFRYPYLAEGKTEEQRAAFRQFLHQHGYKVAAVTMSFGDYLWNGPYERCMTKHDETEVKKLEEGYLEAADESIGFYRSMSQTLYGRDIPYVLLMHVGAFDAEMLPRLLELYRSKGFEFVGLADAERDEFYRSSIDLSLPAEPDMLEEVIRARGLALPERKDFAAELEPVCR